MNKLELLLALLENIKSIFMAIGIICIVMLAFAVSVLGNAIEQYGEESKKMKAFSIKLFKYFGITGFICFIVVSIPNVKDLWEVRIGLIKLELASPENIQKGSEEIIRLGKKLECKYLGCTEEEKK